MVVIILFGLGYVWNIDNYVKSAIDIESKQSFLTKFEIASTNKTSNAS